MHGSIFECPRTRAPVCTQVGFVTAWCVCLHHAGRCTAAHRFDPDLIQDPAIYRLYEAIMHGGDALKVRVSPV